MINMAQVPVGRVGLGSTVVVYDLDAKEETRYELVLPELADLTAGLISVASPIGRGLLDKVAGDRVTIDIPSGKRRFEVVELKTLHDKEPAAGA
jgi:transcription elongation factor GreA